MQMVIVNRLLNEPGPLAAPTPAQIIGPDSIRTALLLTAIVVVAPLAVAFLVPPIGWIPCLWLVAGITLWSDRGGKTNDADQASAADLWFVVRRFLFAGGLLIGVVAFAAPERLFDWPLTRPWIWLSVLASYPVLSVWPHELIYRRFMFRRIRLLGGSDRWSVVISALTFGALHGVYQNALAVVLTLIGGVFFADTYRRTASLRLVCLEHALYGSLIFTIGFGDFFSHLRLAP